nr:MAG TPA: hypothetical protein [Bacteriophage sp.]
MYSVVNYTNKLNSVVQNPESVGGNRPSAQAA